MQSPYFIALWWLLVYDSLLWQTAVARQKFCGDSLSQALDLICTNGYNVLLINPSQKRTESDMDESVATKYKNEVSGELLLSSYPLINGMNPVLSKMFKNMLASVRHRRSRNGLFQGIYDECCTQPCSYGELSAYCRPN
ncbi:probable insulin-like peptide 1 [Anastrepha ludens]|uniref:probable insulin-like peptide 1 n=1 Tax=Anastrepha ludens TaxID=28586 RepID=UPI0023AFDF30|nr:probable insulin-like peptide 1 [Anastrepha ludens]